MHRGLHCIRSKELIQIKRVAPFSQTHAQLSCTPYLATSMALWGGCWLFERHNSDSSEQLRLYMKVSFWIKTTSYNLSAAIDHGESLSQA